MAIDFPNSPTLNQVFNAPTGASYQWNGTVWMPVGASGSLTTSDTPPSSPGPGQLWWNSALGQLMIWFNDGSSSQWVVASPVPMLGGGTGDFYAVHNALPNIPTGAGAQFTLNTVLTGNSGGWYSTSTGRYTPPAGRYHIFAGLSSNVTSATTLDVVIRKNGTALANFAGHSSTSASATLLYVNPTAHLVADASGTDYFDVLIASTAASSTLNGIYFGAYPLTGMQGPIGPSGPSSGLQQTVFFETGAVATGTTVIPFDDTIPQISEGNEYMTLAITPRSATSKLIIEVVAFTTSSVGTQNMTAALFQDSTANALAAGYFTQANAAYGAPISFRHTMTSGTTSATTFRVRAGGSAAGTTTFNGNGGTRYFGGVMASSIVIQEVLP